MANVTMEVKRDVTPEELVEIIKKRGVQTPMVKIEGIAVIRDKDGNIKGTMKFTNEETKDET